MVMLIKFGNYNKNYNYIFYGCIFNVLSYYVSSGNLSQDLFSLHIIDSKSIDSLYIHPLFSDIFNYISIIIISIILHKIKKKKSDIKKENNENIVEENSSRTPLISFYNSDKRVNKNISFLNLIFIFNNF